MTQPILIQFEKSSFNCPLCGAFAEHKWSYAKKLDKKSLDYAIKSERTEEQIKELVFSDCHNCKKHTVWLDIGKGEYKMVYPTGGSAPLPNSDLPENIKIDFEEARNIVELSPRGASALLRLCIQKLCIHLGEKGDKINEDIASLVRKGLPNTIQQALDIVRVIGNNAVHPGVLDLNDDKDTAYKLFVYVNYISDMMITKPKEINETYNLKIPESTKLAIEKRDNN